MDTVIIVHGGAGAWKLDSRRLAAGMEACVAAAARGQAILQAGGTALDAVEQAVWILEDCPALDAGIGSYLNTHGDIEMDALIMDGRTLDLGAVGAVRQMRHPISLARHVMTDSEHAFLVGAGADAFADDIGFPRCPQEELLVNEELTRHDELSQVPDYQTVSIFVEPGAMGDTVGAVALDNAGNLACATSTGGTRQKLPGRVGDSPIPGAGGYADNTTAAVSATGYGEAIMKVLLSKQVCDFVGAGMNAAAACQAALDVLARRVDGRGGLVAVDRQGQIGIAFNTDAMPYAYTVGSGGVTVGR